MLEGPRELLARGCRALLAWVVLLAIVVLVQELVRLVEEERESRARRGRGRSPP